MDKKETPRKEDWELVEQVKNEDSPDALKELCNRHSGIYINAIRRFGAPLNETQIDDLLNEREYNIYIAAKKYNKEKSKFSTFLASQTMYRCLSQSMSNKKNHGINLDGVVFGEADPNPGPDQIVEQKEIFDKILSSIDELENPVEKEILRERYFEGTAFKLKPWKNIASRLGLSVQGCINIHDRVLVEMRKKIKIT